MAFTLFLFFLLAATPSSSFAGQINSNSILIALLDSPYTALTELIEKALLLPTLESLLTHTNITIFAPHNHAFHPDFKHFLLAPANLNSLQTLILSHIVPHRFSSSHFPSLSPLSLSDHRLSFNSATLILPDDILRPDGIIHGIDRLIIPLSVQAAFNNHRSRRSLSALLPTGAPELDPRTNRLKKPLSPSPTGSPPALPIFSAMAPGPSLAPAPAPGPDGAHNHFHGEAMVKDFIQTLLHYGGYNELADILMNLTSIGVEMGRLVSEGYVITVLAPNDEAMGKLTAAQLSEPGAPEEMMNYHMIPEYLTEESMYNAVRRFGRVRYETLRVPLKVTAEEGEGSVKFGSAYLFDPDIYTDGRISVQGIDRVLFPVEDPEPMAVTRPAKIVRESRRGKLMEMTCKVLRRIGVQGFYFTRCQ